MVMQVMDFFFNFIIIMLFVYEYFNITTNMAIRNITRNISATLFIIINPLRRKQSYQCK